MAGARSAAFAAAAALDTKVRAACQTELLHGLHATPAVSVVTAQPFQLIEHVPGWTAQIKEQYLCSLVHEP
jgi:hypothetical protein